MATGNFRNFVGGAGALLTQLCTRVLHFRAGVVGGANRAVAVTVFGSGFYMAGFKVPDFNERAAAARAAKEAALEKLRNKPAPDPAAVAERLAAREAAEAAAAERRAERLRAAEEAKAAKLARKQQLAEEKAAEVPVPARPLIDAAALKAARDARYAARKARKR
jgi:ATPase subunit of ABC transporter with duplicated ATPase domains